MLDWVLNGLLFPLLAAPNGDELVPEPNGFAAGLAKDPNAPPVVLLVLDQDPKDEVVCVLVLNGLGEGVDPKVDEPNVEFPNV